jgi:hypothetical protein
MTPTIFIPSNTSLKDFHESVQHYLANKFHPSSPENHDFDLTPEMEQSAHFAEAYLADDG